MSRKLTGRVDEREVHRRRNDGFGKSSEERFDHVADCIDIRGVINGRMSCYPTSQSGRVAYMRTELTVI